MKPEETITIQVRDDTYYDFSYIEIEKEEIRKIIREELIKMNLIVEVEMD